MPKNRSPRKPHRPKGVGRPVMEGLRAKLIQPSYIALSVLQFADDVEALESARHTLAALLDYMYLATEGRDRSACEVGLDALRAVIDRHERTGVWRCNGQNLAALRAAVAWSDATLPTLRTDKLMHAMVDVHESLGL